MERRAVRASVCEECPRPVPYRVEHLWSELAGEGVLLTRVVRRQQGESLSERSLGAVPELRRTGRTGVACKA